MNEADFYEKDLEWIHKLEDTCKLLNMEIPKHLADRLARCELFLSANRSISSSIERYVQDIEKELEESFNAGNFPNLTRELDNLRYIANNTLLEAYDYN